VCARPTEYNDLVLHYNAVSSSGGSKVVVINVSVAEWIAPPFAPTQDKNRHVRSFCQTPNKSYRIAIDSMNGMDMDYEASGTHFSRNASDEHSFT